MSRQIWRRSRVVVDHEDERPLGVHHGVCGGMLSSGCGSGKAAAPGEACAMTSATRSCRSPWPWPSRAATSSPTRRPAPPRCRRAASSTVRIEYRQPAGCQNVGRHLRRAGRLLRELDAAGGRQLRRRSGAPGHAGRAQLLDGRGHERPGQLAAQRRAPLRAGLRSPPAATRRPEGSRRHASSSGGQSHLPSTTPPGHRRRAASSTSTTTGSGATRSSRARSSEPTGRGSPAAGPRARPRRAAWGEAGSTV